MEYIRFRDTSAAFALPQDEPAPHRCLSALRLLLLLKMCGRRMSTISSLMTCRCLTSKSPQTPTRTSATAAQATTLCGGSLWSLPCVRGLTVYCDVCDVTVGNGIFFRCAPCDYDVCRICLGVHSADRRHGFIHMLTARTRVRRVSKVTRRHIGGLWKMGWQCTLDETVLDESVFWDEPALDENVFSMKLCWTKKGMDENIFE